MRRRHALLSLLLMRDGAQAAAWPARPIRLLVAYPPGGVSDETARLLASGLAQRLQVQVLVENRAGAGGVAAMEALARAAPDGYTLCYSAISPLVIAPLLGKPAYDAQHDFAPVISIVQTPVLLLATAAFKPNTLAEVLALAQTAPGRVRWASSGVATVGHMVIEQLRQASGADITHVPYKGGGQQLVDALSGQFEMLSSNVAAQQLQLLSQGRLKAIAVGAPERLAVLPDVPTLAELGYPQANLVSTFGLFAPRGTPPALIERLNRELNALLRTPAMRARQAAVNNLTRGGSAEEFAWDIAQQRELALHLWSAFAARQR